MSTEIVRAGVIIVAHAIKKELKKKEKPKRQRNIWVKQWMGRREMYGASSSLLKELKDEDALAYRNILRLDCTHFEDLLKMVNGILKKEDTVTRMAIPVISKLEVTLRYLATGDSFKSLQYLFRVPESTISIFLPEVLSAISFVLRPFIEVPKIVDEWKEIENKFSQRWNFPRCVGAIDGKHVIIKRPPCSGSTYFNYKKTYSIILFAMIDADYCFTFIDVGGNGRASDSVIFRDSTLNIAMESNTLGIPDHAVIIGDDSFPLRTNLLKPYSKTGLSDMEKIFNYRLSRARRVVENAFGILHCRKPVMYNNIIILSYKVHQHRCLAGKGVKAIHYSSRYILQKYSHSIWLRAQINYLTKHSTFKIIKKKNDTSNNTSPTNSNTDIWETVVSNNKHSRFPNATSSPAKKVDKNIFISTNRFTLIAPNDEEERMDDTNENIPNKNQTPKLPPILIQAQLNFNNFCIKIKELTDSSEFDFKSSTNNLNFRHTALILKIEPAHPKRDIPKCHRCQAYGHIRSYCNQTPRCVRCGLDYESLHCTKDRSSPAKCALCNGSHPTNYKGRADRPDGTAHGGAALIISNQIEHSPLPPLRSSNILSASTTLKINSVPISIASCYFPPGNSFPTPELIIFLQSLSHSYILDADFNAKHQTWSRSTNTRGRALHNLITQKHLKVLSSPSPTYWPSHDNHHPDTTSLPTYPIVSPQTSQILMTQHQTILQFYYI
ncbi:Harbinger transposase-derived nuclease domain,Endonuclease/exonuclease/phosphatase [Cinara cedri]|uniref:Harbinger transposase-derived nuclease domain,Endonuclease/exonuclease/phosphatase n=1 Tax=Cinara cedri TaxID=506608 RepID=A0A5E4NAV2_9HEMI|nr:Harbinger transposase-derived nuclease domain,Endonuclease/exonuclease/phosphatase [Cinara cedri]